MCDSDVLTSYHQMHFAPAFLPSANDISNSEMESEIFFGIPSVRLPAEDNQSLKDLEVLCSCSGSNILLPRKRQLEEDIKKLQQRLLEEMDTRFVFQRAIENNYLLLQEATNLQSCDQELLCSISELEIAVSNLEQQIISLNIEVTKERNERIISEYYIKQCIDESTSISSSTVQQEMKSLPVNYLEHANSEQHNSTESNSSHETEILNSTERLTTDNKKPVDVLLYKASCLDNKAHEITLEVNKLPRMLSNGLLDQPNIISEEMVKCMKDIFMSLADSPVPSKSSAVECQASTASPRGHFSSSWWLSSDRSIISSWGHSPLIDVKNNSEILGPENVFDPYRVRGKVSWADIGNYSLATEVSWMSVGKNQLEYASGALRKFRILVELLAKVNPVSLSHDEKLAFWINLYNALMMHAYLAYGIPKSDLKLFSLMQKAAYTVGGLSFSAAVIEYAIMKMKPPLHRPQIALILALRKLKVSDEQRKFAVEKHEPSVAFALSSGMYSSPAVRVFSAKNLKEELEDAQHDFIRASVGLSNKGKILVPKMLYCFAKSSVDDSNLTAWILSNLPQPQTAFIEQCISQRYQAIPSFRNCCILPFDSRFRYLFLPDKTSPSWK